MPSARQKPAAPDGARESVPFLLVVPKSEMQGDQQLPLADGATVHILGGAAAEIRDREGRLLIRYEGGHAEIAAPSGDLRLIAPQGRVLIQAGTDIQLDAPGEVMVTAERFFTKVRTLTQHADRLEISAGRIFEKAREAYHDVEELLQTRAGRVRALVEDAYHLQARRTSIASKEDTSIDGKKVLLG
jgi:hypothetical protein